MSAEECASGASFNESDIESITSLDQGDQEEPSSVPLRSVAFRYWRPNILSVLFLLKIGFVIALLAIAAGVGYMSYHFTRAKEIQSYHSAFEEDSDRLINYALDSVAETRLAAMAFAYELTLIFSSPIQFQTWPFVTVSRFEAISFSSLRLSAANNYLLSPIIREEETREAWEIYAISARPGVHNISCSGERSIADGIYRLDDNGAPEDDLGPALYTPIWNVAPISDENSMLMFNQASDPIQRKAITKMVAAKLPMNSETFISKSTGGPQFLQFFPLFDSLTYENVAASLSLPTDVGSLFDTKLSTESTVVAAVVDNQCGQRHTFHIVSDCRERSQPSDTQVIFMGEGDLHNARYDDLARTVTPEQNTQLWIEIQVELPQDLKIFFFGNHTDRKNNTLCENMITFYPTQEYESAFLTGHSVALALGISMALVLTAMLFLAYIVYVERRQGDILKRVKLSSEMNGALVESFFPSFVRDRVVRSSFHHSKAPDLQRSPIRASLNGEQKDFAPIAEQFLNTTVIFADISGFTAWSSQREPDEVFTLLETLYEQFDLLAKRLGVYKVETIGDCYMAVTGLPEPNLHHAIVASRFAYECIVSTKYITTKLEALLGPGTSDLGLRIGLHSGTVTGGVLRGEKARFQLFGDTVNTAARMESNGLTGRVQVSQITADLIIGAGKKHWLIPRRILVKAKGKGEMQTYFVKPRRRCEPVRCSTTSSESQPPFSPPIDDEGSMSEELISEPGDSAPGWGSTSTASFSASPFIDPNGGLIEWNTDNLLNCLLNGDHAADHIVTSSYGIEFGEYQSTVRAQLHALITQLATLFPELAFHNFKRASVIAMFANKLMKEAIRKMRADEGGSPVFEQFYGIVHFTAVFAVLVRDIQYRPADSAINVVTLVLDMLETNSYDALVFALYGCEGNTFEIVLCDCLKPSGTRTSDFYKGFLGRQQNTLTPIKSKDPYAQLPDRMLKIVRLVARSSEVSHWLQHWNSFSSWHRKSLNEIQIKFITDESTYDPSQSWVQDELAFFEHNVLPLAIELDVNGLGNEYLARARENHREWQVVGQQETDRVLAKWRDRVIDIFNIN